MITPEELLDLKETLKLTTPEPWRMDDSTPDDIVIWTGPQGEDAVISVQMGPNFSEMGEIHPQDIADADFIVKARRMVPKLIEEVERLEAVRELAQERLEMANGALEILIKTGRK